MLQIELVASAEVEKAARIFNRDGFVAIANALTTEQLKVAQAGAQRVIDEQVAETPLEKANRGFARYSFGEQLQHPEWQMLVDLPAILPIVDSIWGSKNYRCIGAGGDYSIPGAAIQPLHSDLGEVIYDPSGGASSNDLPAPFIVVNFLMVDFTVENGATRFIPGTQRTRQPIPRLEDEPEWMKKSQICAPAGTALVRDVRCWHAGCPNVSQQIRPMTSVGYFAPWFGGNDGLVQSKVIPRNVYNNLSARSQQLCRNCVAD